ncbi:unnamed protein product, partial [Mycena citricolor]
QDLLVRVLIRSKPARDKRSSGTSESSPSVQWDGCRLPVLQHPIQSHNILTIRKQRGRNISGSPPSFTSRQTGLRRCRP